MFVLRAFPLLALTLIAWNVLVVFGQATSGTVVGMTTLPSGQVWPITAGDAFMVAAFVLLCVEIAAARARPSSFVNHALSLVVFLVAAAEFLFVRRCGEAPFLAMTLISGVDVLAGYCISVRAPYFRRRPDDIED
ncbi:hypothetical protein ACFFJB_13840 [Camelimonas abortus]|uniref:SPW repeat-containing protein n=1 Tax=Camelimonas abortus TaxID=1017184 RepID=A0ABV7LAZ7_9HYPH